MDSRDKIIRGSYGAAVPEFGYAGPPVEVEKGVQFKRQCNFSAFRGSFAVLFSLDNSEMTRKEENMRSIYLKINCKAGKKSEACCEEFGVHTPTIDLCESACCTTCARSTHGSYPRQVSLH